MRCEPAGTDIRMHPTGPITGHARLPGSKSLTNRYLACAALARGRSRLLRPSAADDTERMVAGLRALGVPAAWADPDTLVIDGCQAAWPVDEAHIDAGAAGTAMRFLTALAAAGRGVYTLDGVARMRQRPIGQLVEGLRALGAHIEYAAEPGCPPLVIRAAGLTGGPVVFDTPPSSQFISALLMVAPLALQDVYLSVNGRLSSRPYVDMTIGVMRALGVEVLGHADRFIIPAAQPFRAGEFLIEPDASAAAYFWAAAAVTGGSVLVKGIHRESAQGDARFVDVLQAMGCSATDEAEGLRVAAGAAPLRGVDVDLNAMPDTAQTLAVVALFADGPTTIRNVASLRVKETDRLAALERELGRLGATVDATADGLRIIPPRAIARAAIDTYDDHRMAMSFALAGLVAPGITIRDAGCVSKSFPGYFAALDAL